MQKTQPTPAAWLRTTLGRLSGLMLLMALLVDSSHAQLFSAVESPRAGVYVYTTQATATSASGFVAQSNSQGMQGFAFEGDNIFGDPFGPAVSVFARNTARAVLYSYQTFPTESSATALVARLNQFGAQGYRYIGDHSFAGDMVSLLVRNDSLSTYAWKQRTPATSQAEFLNLINSEGALGYSYKGDVAFADAFGNFVFASLFGKDTTSSGIFSYESTALASSAAAFVVQVNTQGARGFRFRGDYGYGSSGFEFASLYIKDSARPDNFVFEALSPPNSTAAFLSQANAQGARRFSYQGNIAFGSSLTETFALYVSVQPLFASGFE